MMHLALPLLVLAVLVPIACGLVIARLRAEQMARGYAMAAAVAVLGLTMAIAVVFYLRGMHGYLTASWALPLLGAARPLLGVDSLSAPLLPLVALITLATIIARPRRVAAPHVLGALLVTQGLLLGLLTALDLGLLTLFWILAPAPVLLEARRARAMARTWAVFLVMGALPLVAAAGVLLLSGLAAGIDAPLSLEVILAHGLHTRAELTAGVLIGLAVLLRSAAVPVHGWVPLSFEHGPPGMVTVLWAAQPGAYLLARVLLPVLSAAPAGAASPRIVLVAIGLLSAVYAALVGLAQNDLKRAIGYLAVSYSGLVLVGLASTHSDGIGGALVLWLSSGVALSGLVLTAVALEARTGTTDMRRLGGLSRALPRLAMAFAIFGLAAVGLPGLLGFVAEDLLVHGVVESYPMIAAGLLAATVLNGITMMRAFARAFLGEPAPSGVRVPAGRDLRARERLAVTVLAGILVVFGLAPRALVSLRAETAADLATVAAPHGPTD